MRGPCFLMGQCLAEARELGVLLYLQMVRAMSY
jgi:hypothetical protein